jgi:transposase
VNDRRSRKEKIVPRLLRARRPEDAEEERKVRKLASSRHAPGDWILRARIISRSWQGLRNAKIAEELGCHLKTVRKRIHRFNDEGIDGLGDRPRTGRRPHLTQPERSKIIALVAKNPPGKLVTEPDGVLRAEDETKAAYWTLDALAEAAREIGIKISRSQVRRILLHEGVRWRNTRPWAQSSDPEFVPKGQGSLSSTPIRHRTPQWSVWTSSALSLRGPFLRLRDGRRTDTA